MYEMQDSERAETIEDPVKFKNSLLEFMRVDKDRNNADMFLMDQFSVRGTGIELIDLDIPDTRATLADSKYFCMLCHMTGER